VGRDTRDSSLAVLAPFGRLVHFGTASGDPGPVAVEDLYERSLQVSAYWLRTPHPPAAARHAAASLLDGIADGTLRVPPATVFSLAEAADAHRALESRQTVGKLLLRVECRHIDGDRRDRERIGAERDKEIEEARGSK